MSLKDEIATDIYNTFFNLMEFAEEHTVEGENLVCIIDVDHQQPGSRDVIASDQKTLFFKSEDGPAPMAPGNLLNIDGGEYIIQSWDEKNGVSEVKITDNY